MLIIMQAIHTSHQSFRKFQAIIANIIRDKIIKELKCCDFFSLMFDETTDVSGANILTLVARYITTIVFFIGYFSLWYNIRLEVSHNNFRVANHSFWRKKRIQFIYNQRLKNKILQISIQTSNMYFEFIIIYLHFYIYF